MAAPMIDLVAEICGSSDEGFRGDVESPGYAVASRAHVREGPQTNSDSKDQLG